MLAFVVITDTHISDEQARLDQLSHTVSDINRSKHFPLPDFVVLTGDLTESGSSVELSAIKSALDKLDVTYYPITGNHDSDSESGEEKGHLWASIFGNNRFSYSWVNSDFLFLAMDVNTPYGGYGYKLNNSAHNTWLQNLLNSNPDKFVFLFSHYSLNGNRDGGAAKFHWETDGSEMMAILESHANVVAQFAGHNHLFGTSKFNGVSYITTGAFNANDSYRYIEVYVDRTECHVLKNLFYRYNYAGNTWPGSTDTTHTVSTYSFGLPMERQFKIHHKSKTNDILDAISVVGNASWTNLSYKADITLGEEDFLGKNVAGLVFRYNDPDNYYSVLLDSADNKIELQMKHNGVVTELASMPILIDVNTKYTMKVSAIGKGIKVYLNNALTISVSDATFVSGTVGVRSYLAPTSFDNITTSDPLSRFR